MNHYEHIPQGEQSPEGAVQPLYHRRSRRLWWRPVVLVLLILALISLISMAKNRGWLGPLSANDMPDRGLYQAVFLDNGQVYFGKINEINKKSIVLTDIYYLQVTQPLQQQTPGQTPPAGSNNQPVVNLVKIGSEIHGPTDKMVIERESIVFWEDIKTDGVVGKAITEFKGRQN